MRSKRLALDSILLALAAAFSFLESMIPTPVGIRLGLSSIVVMYALLCLSKAEASAIVLLKACFALITRGFYAGILSLSGSFLSLLGMLILYRMNSSLVLMSCIGGFLHNLGQILAASLFLGSGSVFSYLPILTAAGLTAGFVSASLLRMILPYLPYSNCSIRSSQFLKGPDK